MVFNTATVGAAVTPTIIETWFAHVRIGDESCFRQSQRLTLFQYLNRSPRKGKPTAHLSYDAALHLIRQFLVYSSHHTVEDVQAFTQQWVPTPSWVKTEDVLIPESYISTAVQHLHTQLGVQGLEQIGGRYWWQWRRDHTPLKGEWIEMKKDADLRKKKGNKCQRSMLYIHGTWSTRAPSCFGRVLTSVQEEPTTLAAWASTGIRSSAMRGNYKPASSRLDTDSHRSSRFHAGCSIVWPRISSCSRRSLPRRSFSPATRREEAWPWPCS